VTLLLFFSLRQWTACSPSCPFAPGIYFYFYFYFYFYSIFVLLFPDGGMLVLFLPLCPCRSIFIFIFIFILFLFCLFPLRWWNACSLLAPLLLYIYPPIYLCIYVNISIHLSYISIYLYRPMYLYCSLIPIYLCSSYIYLSI